MTFDPPPAASPFPSSGVTVDPYREPTFDPWATVRPAGFGARRST